MTATCQESYDKPRQCVEKQRHHFVIKGVYSQGYDLSSSHVLMQEFSTKKAECQRIDVFNL